MWVVGIDEAGYGPSVGPLVVAAVAAEGTPEQVADKLSSLSVPIGDSKRLFRGDVAPLERVVLGLFDSVPESAAVLLESLCEQMPPRPFYWRNLALPLSQVHYEPLKLAFSVRACVVTAAEFNRELQQTPNKAALLWRRVCRLLNWARRTAKRPLSVICDRLGSRKDYARLLQQHFALVSQHRSDADSWSYRLPDRTDITFCTNADARFPLVGLASMVAKYLREVLMRMLNDWLKEKGLCERAVTGYADRPLVRTIARKLEELNIPSESFLRMV